MLGRAGRRALPVRPRMFTVAERAMKTERIVEAMYPAQPNHRKAVLAWASRQRFPVLLEPSVISLVVVYD